MTGPDRIGPETPSRMRWSAALSENSMLTRLRRVSAGLSNPRHIALTAELEIIGCATENQSIVISTAHKGRMDSAADRLVSKSWSDSRWMPERKISTEIF